MIASKGFEEKSIRRAVATLLALALVGVWFVPWSAPAEAATIFTVNRTGDGADRNISDSVCDVSSKARNQCTLRAAIQESNDTSGPDKIKFNIRSTAAVKTISPARSLPTITEALTIDGYSQGSRTTTTSDDAKPNTLAEGNNADLKIRLDGTNAGAGVSGLTVTDADTAIKGLVINRFRGQGVLLTGSSATGNQIEGSFIGTDASGTRDLGNGSGSRSGGVAIQGASGNLVGGTDPSARNLISGNNWIGISITGKGAANNRVENNYLGTDASGTNKLRNELDGVVIHNAPRNSIGGTAAGAGNVISASLDYGVNINGTTATDNRVQGNLIGTDVSGTKALGNALSGVELAAPGNLVGGTVAGAGNVISGNWRGVTVSGMRNRIEGNHIGTDASGSQKLPNEQSGVVVGGDNVVGGTAAGAGNVISGNAEHGILVGGNSRIEGNHIGTDASDAQDLGNGQFGVYIQGHDNTIGKGNTIAHNPSGGVRIGGSRNKVEGNTIESNGGSGVDLIHSIWSPTNDNVIGGTTSAQANVIHDNGGAGVQVRLLYETSNSGNSILTNSIFANGGLGISLGAVYNSITNNDVDDPDAGPNNLQNFPVITSAERNPATGETTVTGTLNSNPNQTYTIQCFSAEAGSTDRNYGEGKTFLGQATTTTDANGDSPPFACTSDIPAVGDKVTATATNTSGTATNTRIGDTSGFSLNVEVTSSP